MTGPTPINPHEARSVTLAAAEWNSVLQILQDGPYRTVSPLIDQIVRQCTAQPTPLNRPRPLTPYEEAS
jgi:hypothetical protein